MNKRKWIANLAMLLCMVMVFFMMSGSYHEACADSTITVGENTYTVSTVLYFADESSTTFKSDGSGTSIYVNVLYDNTVSIPMTVYVLHTSEQISADRYTVKIDGTSYPCTWGNYNGQEVLAASGTLTFTAAAGVANKTVSISGSYVDDDGNNVSAFSDSFIIRSVEAFSCEACGSAAFKSDGTISHGYCPGCNRPCNDGEIEHEYCPACGSACQGSGLTHASCENCGAVCTGEGVIHGSCAGCEAVCEEGEMTHVSCTACGAACEGEGVIHGSCAGCGAACEDGVITHGSCAGCEAACEDGEMTHVKCAACGAACEGEGLTHGKCAGCDAPCQNGTITHASCADCGAVCAGNGLTHKDNCGDEPEEPSEPSTTPTTPSEPSTTPSEPSTTPTTPSKPTDPSNPGTGDMGILAASALAISSMMGMGIVIGKKRR